MSDLMNVLQSKYEAGNYSFEFKAMIVPESMFDPYSSVYSGACMTRVVVRTRGKKYITWAHWDDDVENPSENASDLLDVFEIGSARLVNGDEWDDVPLDTVVSADGIPIIRMVKMDAQEPING